MTIFQGTYLTIISGRFWTRTLMDAKKNESNEINNLLDKIECIKSIDKELKEMRRRYYIHAGNYLSGNTDSLKQKGKIKKLIDEKLTLFNECLNVDKIIICPNKNYKYK